MKVFDDSEVPSAEYSVVYVTVDCELGVTDDCIVCVPENCILLVTKDYIHTLTLYPVVGSPAILDSVVRALCLAGALLCLMSLHLFF